MHLIRNHGVRVLVTHSIGIYLAFALCWALCWVLEEIMVQGNKTSLCFHRSYSRIGNRDKVSRQLLSRVINVCWGNVDAYGSIPYPDWGDRPNKMYFIS